MVGFGGDENALLGGIAPELVDSRPVTDSNGALVEGMYGLELQLWP
jgi:hypothetical protein